MKKQQILRIAIFILLSIKATLSHSQIVRIETAEFLYWQPNVEVGFSDFQRTEIDPRGMELMDKYSFKSLPNVQIHCILDLPKKRKKIKKYPEQWYIAPTFCKKCSPIIERDSIELEIASIYFDIAEYCSRIARRNLYELDSHQDAPGFIAAVFPMQVDEMYSLMREMFGSFNKSVTESRVDAINEWKPAVIEMLSSTEDFKTTAADCDRFLTSKPKNDQYKTVYEKYGQ